MNKQTMQRTDTHTYAHKHNNPNYVVLLLASATGVVFLCVWFTCMLCICCEDVLKIESVLAYLRALFVVGLNFDSVYTSMYLDGNLKSNQI